MVIQPLVENAIVHGLEKSLKPGSILIGAGRNPRHGYLAIWIFDTGVGMPPEKLQELRHSIAASVHDKTGDASADLAKMDAQNHDSIGILNVNSIMELTTLFSLTLRKVWELIFSCGSLIRQMIFTNITTVHPFIRASKGEYLYVSGNCN